MQEKGLNRIPVKNRGDPADTQLFLSTRSIESYGVKTDRHRQEQRPSVEIARNGVGQEMRWQVVEYEIQEKSCVCGMSGQIAHKEGASDPLWCLLRGSDSS